MLEPHLSNCFSDARRLADVVFRRAAVGDRTVRTVSRTDVAEDHEGRGPVLPALANVGAVCLFADGVKIELAHQMLQPQILRAARRLDLEPARLPFRQRFNAMPSG